MHIAVRENHLQVVKYIYENESQFDAKHTLHLLEDKTPEGDTCLMIAVMN
jgi:ankyrin repeat protein